MRMIKFRAKRVNGGEWVKRYLPPKEAVQQCYNAFGIRVGLGDNWEDIYDGWNKEMK